MDALRGNLKDRNTAQHQLQYLQIEQKRYPLSAMNLLMRKG